ncbi:M23 family metallopeptidase [Pedobacter faecalis]|uniref:M23 family metallopeptidase n=1 Tax=Pedobacter faecalis TaxID=3041495 RepID=UPI002550C67D|nr:M23 family metallopeptidase [Pedobacter sp. ELA7]
MFYTVDRFGLGKVRALWCAAVLLLGLQACRTGPINLFKAASPHDAYQRKLVSSGLDRTAMGAQWISAAEQSRTRALRINVPFKESGYFAAEKVPAVAYTFEAVRGQKLTLSLTKTPAEGFMIYMDLWELRDDREAKLVASADTVGSPISLEASRATTYMLRLQPELLRSGSYTLQITAGPSLDYPTASSKQHRIQSFFGDGRDANTRKHQGVDIFAPRRTPALAVAEGTVLRVNENNLGGRVVWLRPSGKDYTVYYAHLDEQIAREGQSVKPGDTLGLIGNTGNAKTTAPHLHFGIYTSEGAVDPFHFINPVVKTPPEITASLSALNATRRTLRSAGLYTGADRASNELATLPANTVLHITGASGSWYRVQLPDQTLGYVESRHTGSVETPVRRLTLRNEAQPLYDRPDSAAAVKRLASAGEAVSVIGTFKGHLLVRDKEQETGWIRE